MTLKTITSADAPKAIGPYAQGIETGGLIYTSGQIPLDVNGTMVPGGIKEQTHQVFRNLQAVLKEAGCTLEHVIKTTVFLQDMGQFHDMNEVYASYFGSHKPARSTVQVARLPKDALVEIEVIARKPE